ncbi:MAG: GAF domain-containing protein [Thermodesulfovibrionales bacterium]|nr:GAF domain-containing protein [Thermodesulfovibrionales bacterium]
MERGINNKTVSDIFGGKEKFLEAVLGSIQDGISVSDKDLNILYVNPVMEKWYPRTMPLLGKKCFEAYHGHTEPCEICPSMRTLKSGKQDFDIVPYIGTEGDKGWMELFTFPLIDPVTGQINGVIEYVRDITARRQAELKVVRLNRVYSMLRGINEAIVRIRDRGELFREACRIAVESGKFKMAWIGIVEPETMLVKPVAVHGDDEEYVNKLGISLSDTPEGRGPTATAIREGTYFICNDIENDERMLPWRDEARRSGFRSSAAFPLKIRGRTIGSVNIYSSEPGFFDEEEVRLFDELSTDISFALEVMEKEKQREKMEEELKGRVHELQKFYEMTVGRELKMKELKKEIEKLKEKLEKQGAL